MRKIMIAAVIVCIFLTGCKSVTPALGQEAESGEGLESLKQLGSMEGLEIKELEDNWPESLCYNADGVSGYPLYTEIEIDTPMTLSVSCETWSGSLKLKIVNADTHEVCFNETDPEGEYTAEIDKEGTWQVLFYAREHVGNVIIVPEGD